MKPGDLLIIPSQLEYGVNEPQIAIYLGSSPGRKEGFFPVHRILTPSGKVLQMMDPGDSVINLSDEQRQDET